MKRLRIALLAGLATLALGTVSIPVAAAAPNGTSVPPKTNSLPALKTVGVHGMAKNGKPFNGTYAIQRYVAGAHKVYAVGTLKGTLKGRHVTRYNVMIPATLAGRPANAARAVQATCTVLQLQLGPIKLNLLGLRVQLFGGTDSANPLPVTLLITGKTGNGNLLGNLLCNLTGVLNQGGLLSQLNSNLQQLAATLTSLTSLLGAV